MTTPAITLDQSQTLTPAASQNATQKGSLEGRSIVPSPSKLWLTDVQFKRIALVAFAIFATAAFAALGGAFFVGAVPIILGALIVGSQGAMLGGAIAAFAWPKVDYQTAKGAATIRNDLKTKDFSDLENNYSFSDLAKYGYISIENAKKMQDLRDSSSGYTIYCRDHSGEHTYSYQADHVPLHGDRDVNTYLHNAKISAFEFNNLRNQPGFLL